MDVLLNQLFGVKIFALHKSSLLPSISFPGNHNVSAVLGCHLGEDEPAWKNVKRDVFICAEEALDALGHVSKTIPAQITVSSLYEMANGLAKRVNLEDLETMGDSVFVTFVPLSLLIGRILLFAHQLDIPAKLRVSTFAVSAIQKSLGEHPQIGQLPASSSRTTALSSSSFSSAASPSAITRDESDPPPFPRFYELGVTPEEFERSQVPKYANAYKLMRTLVPPNIAKSTLKSVLHDGVPKPLARHIWDTKVLWLLCMHPADLLKVHVADLRSKYHFHTLDLTEMRALHFWLPRWTGDSVKAEWRANFKRRLDRLVCLDIFGDEDQGQSVNRETNDEATEGDGSLVSRRHPCYEIAGVDEGFYDPSMPLRKMFCFKEGGSPLALSSRSRDMSDVFGDDGGDLHYSTSIRHSGSIMVRSTVPEAADSENENRINVLSGDLDEHDARPVLDTRRTHSQIEAALASLDVPSEAKRHKSMNSAKASDVCTATLNHISAELEPPLHADEQSIHDLRSTYRNKSKSVSLPLAYRPHTLPHTHTHTHTHTPTHAAKSENFHPDDQILELSVRTDLALDAPDFVDDLAIALHSSPSAAATRAAGVCTTHGQSTHVHPASNLNHSHPDIAAMESEDDEHAQHLVYYNSVEYVDLSSSDSEDGTDFSRVSGLARRAASSKGKLRGMMNASISYDGNGQDTSRDSVNSAESVSFKGLESPLASPSPSPCTVSRAKTLPLSLWMQSFLSPLSRTMSVTAAASSAQTGSSTASTIATPNRQSWYTPHANDANDLSIDDMDCEDFENMSTDLNEGSSSDTHSRGSWTRSIGTTSLSDSNEELEDEVEVMYEAFLLESGRQPYASRKSYDKRRSYVYADSRAGRDCAAWGVDGAVTSEMYAALESLFGSSEAGAALSVKSVRGGPKQAPVGGPQESDAVSSRDRAILGAVSSLSARSDAQSGLVTNTNSCPVTSSDSNPVDGASSNPSTPVHSPAKPAGSPFWNDVWAMLTPEEVQTELDLEAEIDAFVPLDLEVDGPKCQHRHGANGLNKEDASSSDGSDGSEHSYHWILSDEEDTMDDGIAVPSMPTYNKVEVPVLTWEQGEWCDGQGQVPSDLNIEEGVLCGDARQVRAILCTLTAEADSAGGRDESSENSIEKGRLAISATRATELLLRCANQPDELLEPLETLMLLLDDLRADVNAVDPTTGNTPLHSLFARPMLGRLLVSRGADVLAHDAFGETPLGLCLEYDYDYLVPAFIATGGEDALIKSNQSGRITEYCEILLSMGGYGKRVSELVDGGSVQISGERALELLERCRVLGYDRMKQPVETFELLQKLALEG